MKSLVNIYFNSKANLFFLLFILFVGFSFRIFGLNWDDGNYFHPDERAIVTTVLNLEVPSNKHDLLKADSTLNPKFFAYGSFPMYLLKFSSDFFSYIDPSFKEYESIYLVGRLLSAIFDSVTIFAIYLIGVRVFSKKIGLLGSLFYALSVLPIQLAHYYAVDTILTTFILLSLLSLIVYLQDRKAKSLIFCGIFFGLALSTKISALVLLPTVFLGLFLFSWKEPIKKRIFSSFTMLLVALIVTAITQPYMIIDFNNFKSQTILQSQMSKNPFIFPYTLQYVGKAKYLYELSQIFLWGQGVIISILSISGILLLSLKLKKIREKYSSLLLIYTLSYFLVFGSFAVGFMRYMLPIYPGLAIFASWFVFKIFDFKKINEKFARIFTIIIIVSSFIYPLSFLSIYSKPNTRILASNWIIKNIPSGSNIAVEHWDDMLPIHNAERYSHLIFPLYDEDTLEKWNNIGKQIDKTDYIIIASNRLYAPLQRLTNCESLPKERCYIATSEYYKSLFSGRLGFEKIAEFKNYPTIPILNIPINDQLADENFTVFDHPKIMIFKKIDVDLEQSN